MTSSPLNHPSIIPFPAVLHYVALCANAVEVIDRGLRVGVGARVLPLRPSATSHGYGAV